jgi:hypothetical protein
VLGTARGAGKQETELKSSRNIGAASTPRCSARSGARKNAAEREGRICDLPIDRAYPVYTWDGL